MLRLCSSMVPILDALAQNSSVTSFTICDNSTEGWGRALQDLLERNTTLQSLRMLRLLHKLAAFAQKRRSTTAVNRMQPGSEPDRGTGARDEKQHNAKGACYSSATHTHAE